tara:strand:+ start:273 stop:941 length:669 start_codon:yes stop_codon:yes gene_type:complete
MAIQEFGTALLKQYLTNKLVDKGIKGIEKYTGTSSDDDDTGKGFTSTQKTGGLGSILGRALAFGLLGPIAGPLALAAGKGILNLGKQQGLGFSPFGGDGPTGPAGIISGKVQTLDGRIVDAGSDEAIADMNKRDEEFQETGDYDVYSDAVTTGPAYSGTATVGTRFDAEDDGGGDDNSGGSGGGNTSSDQGETSSDSGFSDSGSYEDFGTMYARGGLASLYR